MTDSHDHEHDHEHQHHTLSYEDAIAEFRADKDEFFRTTTGARSRRPSGRRFDGLPYFPVDASLVFDDLALEPYAG